MSTFPAVVYDLGNWKGKLPELCRPVIDNAMAELMRLHRECAMLEAALRVESQPRHITNLEDIL